MRTLVHIFRHNWPLKVIAVGLALLLWAVVLLRTNPWTTEWLEVAVETRQVPEGLQVMSVTPARIKVRLAGRRHSVDRLAGRTLSAQAVIGSRDVGEHEVPVVFDNTKLPRGVEVLDLSAYTVRVSLDQTVQQMRPVLAEFRGRTASGFAAVPGRPRPNEVSVGGPLTLVNAVAAVVAVVDYSGIQTARTFTSRLEARDARGMPQQGVTITPPTAKIEVVVEPINVKTVPVQLQLSAPAGRRVQSVDMSPSVVTITGKPDLLRSVQFLRTRPVRATEDGVLPNVPLQLPPGVAVVGNEASVRVTVSLAPLYEVRPPAPAPAPAPAPRGAAPSTGETKEGGHAPETTPPEGGPPEPPGEPPHPKGPDNVPKEGEGGNG
jgi:YbbR domain-containing protein